MATINERAHRDDDAGSPAGSNGSDAAAVQPGPMLVQPIDAPPPETYAEHLVSAGEMEEPGPEVVHTDAQRLVQTPAGLQAALEALLFAAPEPVTVRRLCQALGVSDARLVAAALERLREQYDQEGRGLQIRQTAVGYQMATREAFGDFVLRLQGRKRRPPLSPAALETLAIIAYRQPIIRAEIEAIRGVESSGTLRNLLDLGLIEVVGHREVLGRPRMYGTTQAFLTAFGLRSLQDLPPISELKRELQAKEAAEAIATAAPGSTEATERPAALTLQAPQLPLDSPVPEIPAADPLDAGPPPSPAPADTAPASAARGPKDPDAWDDESEEDDEDFDEDAPGEDEELEEDQDEEDWEEDELEGDEEEDWDDEEDDEPTDDEEDEDEEDPDWEPDDDEDAPDERRR